MIVCVFVYLIVCVFGYGCRHGCKCVNGNIFIATKRDAGGVWYVCVCVCAYADISVGVVYVYSAPICGCVTRE